MTEGVKGTRGGLCNRSACLAPDANYYNRGSLNWYCWNCASILNRANWDVKFEDGQPMVIPIPREASDERVSELTRFCNIVKG